MKKIFTLILSLSMAMMALPLFAQQTKSEKEKHEMRREMEEYKVKYLAQEMELKGETKEKFEELYKERTKALGAIFKARHQAEKKLKGMTNPSDADYEEYRRIQNETKEKEAEITKEYDAKFNSLLSSKEFFRMQEAEGKFREKMKELKAARKGEKGARPKGANAGGKK